MFSKVCLVRFQKSEVFPWGGDIAVAQKYLRTAPYMLFFPAAFLSMAVLAFIMLGDAVRDALNPRLR